MIRSFALGIAAGLCVIAFAAPAGETVLERPGWPKLAWAMFSSWVRPVDLVGG